LSNTGKVGQLNKTENSTSNIPELPVIVGVSVGGVDHVSHIGI